MNFPDVFNRTEGLKLQYKMLRNKKKANNMNYCKVAKNLIRNYEIRYLHNTMKKQIAAKCDSSNKAGICQGKVA